MRPSSTHLPSHTNTAAPEALAAADPTCLDRVDVLLACGTAMAAACAAPGWLLRAAAPEEGEVLSVLHADLLAALKVGPRLQLGWVPDDLW